MTKKMTKKKCATCGGTLSIFKSTMWDDKSKKMVHVCDNKICDKPFRVKIQEGTNNGGTI